MSAAHRKAARGAAEKLLGIAGAFWFASERDKSAWLAGLLTVCFRHRIEGPVPMFWIFGNVGTGKTLLADHTARTATGKEPIHFSSVGSAGGLKSLVRRQNAMVIIDNVLGPLNEQLLCSLITAQVLVDVSSRNLLAKRYAQNTVFWATGPRVECAEKGDLVRRVIPIELSTSSPGQLSGGPMGSLLCGNVLREAEIMLPYVQHVSEGGPRAKVRPWEQFPEWSEQIREPMVWAGLLDPVPPEAVEQALRSGK